MKKCFAQFLIGLSFLFAGVMAWAQAAPNVQSVDILQPRQIESAPAQPGNAAPVYRQIADGEVHYTSNPALEAGMLIQPKAQFPGQARATTAGEAWRQYRNGPLTFYGGWLLVLTAALLAIVYLAKGPIKLKGTPTGRLIERFTSVERIAHWTMAISFVVLAISGIIMLFGKYILLPVFGYTLFGWLSYTLKTIHNFVGPVFTVSILVFFVIYVRDNMPHRSDIKWLSRAGGMLGGEHVPSGRFNAGEKIWFWMGVVLLGLIISGSGFFLDMLVPGAEYTRGNMQIASIVHIIAAVLVMAMSIGHIYMGTVGMEGAYKAMRTGYVDDTWAKEHHELWYEEVQHGKVPRVRSEESPDKDVSPVKA